MRRSSEQAPRGMSFDGVQCKEQSDKGPAEIEAFRVEGSRGSQTAPEFRLLEETQSPRSRCFSGG